MADRVSVSHITDDMVEAAARELHSNYDSEFDAPHLSWRDFEGQARRVLSAALAGCTVVQLPEPDGYDEADGTWWWNTHLGRMLSRTGKYDVERENNYRATAAAMLAAAEHHKQLRLAAREARRLAAGGGLHGE